MGMRRIIYACTLAGSALFSVLYPFWFSLYLLVLVLLLVPLDFFVSLPGMLSRRVLLSAPKVLDRGDNGVLVVTTQRDKPYPARCVKAWLKISGDDFTTRRRIVLSAERGSRYEVEIDTSRSGVTVFESRRIWTVSLLGLFCIPADVNCKASVLVLPQPTKPPSTVAMPHGVILRPKPGGGFAEDYDMRPYRKGDPIKSVHWKVSAKFDSLIIREPLVPPAHSRLLYTTKWDNARERDLILGRLRWVSDYLLKWDIQYYFRLGDDGPVAEISRTEDLHNYLYLVLSGDGNLLPNPMALPTRFAWLFRIDASETTQAKA